MFAGQSIIGKKGRSFRQTVMDLKDKIVLITGASSGIGETFAKLVAKKGAKVILQARSADKLSALADNISKDGGVAFAYPTDVSNADAVLEQAQKIMKEVGVPDIILNAAGAGNWLSVFDTTEKEFKEMMDAPFFATIYTIKAFLNEMVKRNSGHIITINSPACYFVFPGALGYSSARSATRAFLEGLTEELRSTKIAVTSIVAGKVDSPYFDNNPVSAERIPGIATSLMSTLSVDQVARVVLKSLKSRKKTIIIPRQMALSVFFNRYFPGMFRVLNRITGYRGIPEEIAKIRDFK